MSILSNQQSNVQKLVPQDFTSQTRPPRRWFKTFITDAAAVRCRLRRRSHPRTSSPTWPMFICLSASVPFYADGGRDGGGESRAVHKLEDVPGEKERWHFWHPISIVFPPGSHRNWVKTKRQLYSVSRIESKLDGWMIRRKSYSAFFESGIGFYWERLERGWGGERGSAELAYSYSFPWWSRLVALVRRKECDWKTIMGKILWVLIWCGACCFGSLSINLLDLSWRMKESGHQWLIRKVDRNGEKGLELANYFWD